VRIGRSLDEPLLLESVEHSRGRTRGQLGLLAHLSRRHRAAVAGDEAQCLQVDDVQAERAGDAFVGHHRGGDDELEQLDDALADLSLG
jgi:hypothetical protein